jgi:ferritin-like metal-binding protein YciE
MTFQQIPDTHLILHGRSQSMSIKDQLIVWLNEAHFMEIGVMEMLNAHLTQAEEHPRLHTLLREHLVDTQHHAEEVKRCLRLLGADVSVPAASMTRAGALLGHIFEFRMPSSVENTILDLATKHFEISAYISLISAATDLAEPEIVKICENILEEEESMAERLMVQLPEITSTYLEVLFLRGRKNLGSANGSNYSNPPFTLKRIFPVSKTLRTATPQAASLARPAPRALSL